MYKIVEARGVGLNIKQFVIEAPRIAGKQQPGQFVILRIDEHGERIPLTVAESNPADGTITIIVQGIGKTTKQLNTFKVGDTIRGFKEILDGKHDDSKPETRTRNPGYLLVGLLRCGSCGAALTPATALLTFALSSSASCCEVAASEARVNERIARFRATLSSASRCLTSRTPAFHTGIGLLAATP